MSSTTNIDKEVERILALSDDEILAEVRASGLDPNEIARHWKLRIEMIIYKVENEWLRRLLKWCRPRLKNHYYQEGLDKYLAAGPTPEPKNEPPIARS